MSSDSSIFDKSNRDGVYPQLAKLEDTLGLPAGFCEGLLREDDWSFVIKLHAILEAAVTTILVEKMGYAALQPVFARIEMSQEGSGKLAFAEAVSLLDGIDRRFIRKLSELRNQLVHRIQNVSFTVRSHVDALDTNQKESFVKAFGLWNSEDNILPRLHKYAMAHPKDFVWQGGLMILAILMMKVETIRTERDMDTKLRKFGAETLARETMTLRELFALAQSTDQAPEGS
jgi:hypothetical protein